MLISFFYFQCISGCRFPDFTMYREGDICISIFSAENMTSLYASTTCKHRGGELVSLDTDGKIQFLKTYLLQYCEFFMFFLKKENKNVNG